MHPYLPSTAVRTGAASGGVAAIRDVATSNTIQLNDFAYTAVAVALALAGVWLSRMVSIDEENKRIGRTQTLRETGPLTWIAVLIVCPIIWDMRIAIPWAVFIGLGVGYSVRVMLRIFGKGAASAARALMRETAEALESKGEAHSDPTPLTGRDGEAIKRAMEQLDKVPE